MREFTRGCGGIGRRAGLRIQFPQGSESSSLSIRTKTGVDSYFPLSTARALGVHFMIYLFGNRVCNAYSIRSGGPSYSEIGAEEK